MKIGIIGAGNIGASLACHFVKAGHTVRISNKRGPAVLAPLISELGHLAAAVSNEEAAANEIVVLAVWWKLTDEVLQPLRELLKDKIVIDATNPFVDGQFLDLPKGTAASEIIASKIPGAKVVKAFNCLYARWINADPIVGNGRRVTFISGDDVTAKDKISTLIRSINFAPVDLGTLKDGEMSQAGRPLAEANFVLYPND